MDELDKLKSSWKKEENTYPKFSEKDIYAMLHKKSSSIVKWILIISIAEFVFWISLSFLLKDSPNARNMQTLNIDYITTPMSIISNGIILYFVYIFYMRYKKISVTDDAKTLMQNILKTRKAVSVYIFVNIAYSVLSAIIIVIVMFNTDAGLNTLVHQAEDNGNKLLFYLVAFIFSIIILGIFILVMWLFYRLIYGLLLKRLYKNFEELKKIDF